MRLIGALDYAGAATCEFLVDLDRGTSAFLEINARLQVEHPVTEMVTGIDIVREQLRIAGGEGLSFAQDDVEISGHAIEVRINAERPGGRLRRRRPGTIDRWAAPVGSDVRVDTACFPGWTVPPYYDSLLAKLIARGPTATTRCGAPDHALRHLRVEGVDDDRRLRPRRARAPRRRRRRVHTRWLEEEFLPGWTATRRRRPDGRIEFIDQSLRDGQQSLWGMRMRAGHILPVADAIDTAGYRVVDLTGSSIFEVMVRFRQEDPWRGLDAIRAALPADRRCARGRATTASSAWASRPDSIVELWVQTLAKHGIGSLWIFDCLHDVDKMLAGREDRPRRRRQPSPQLNFSESPVHTDEYYADDHRAHGRAAAPRRRSSSATRPACWGPERARQWIRLMQDARRTACRWRCTSTTAPRWRRSTTSSGWRRA